MKSVTQSSNGSDAIFTNELIIGIVEGSKPALADHATDDMAFSNLIKQILKDLVHRLSDVSQAIIQFFAHFLVEPKTEWDFQTKHEFYTHMESQDLRTLQGEKVKSDEELQIANWLYENGVEYEYEPLYKHKIPETGRRDYQPGSRACISHSRPSTPQKACKPIT